jgi:Na+/H+ antiporter NhaC
MMIARIIKTAIVATATICAAAQSTQDTLFSSTTGTPYEVEIDSLSLTDVATGVKDIATIHNSRPFNVIATLKWNQEIYNLDSSNSLEWVLFVDGVYQSDGTVDLNEHRALPTTLEAGTATVYNSGSHNIAVKIKVDDMKNENERDYESFASGASFVPLLMVMIFATTTHMVELSLGMGIFVGSCMVAGTLTAGFRNMLDVYLLNAVSKKDHAYVFLFILFMAGLVGLIEKSGGLRGITESLKKYVKTSRSAQAASLFSGVIIFFDDYANTLVAGASMRSLADACGVSREKLAFIVDATAAPIASIVPISSWVGFEVGLIQEQLTTILEQDPNPDIATTGFGVFLETIQYRYYCIFMLFLLPLLVVSGRDMGPMLIAERKIKVYGRTDGGDGAAKSADGQVKSENMPEADTPCKWWNMAVPIASLVGYIFYLLAYTGQSGENDSFMKMMENSNSYQALLWGTMAAALTSVAFFFIQDKKSGKIIFFNVKGYVNKMRRFFAQHSGKCGHEEPEESDEEVHAQVLLNYREAMSAFMMGMEKVFGALVCLVLAWATGEIMQAVGLNRLFGEIITGSLDYRVLPTLSFVISVMIAFATGTSWGTMTIMFPLVLVPSYQASGGNAAIFYGVAAGVLAGAVAGDHASPISDTTILASMATECEILAHVKTQAPYAMLVVFWSILVGTIPSGWGAFANWVSILLGLGMMAFHVVFTAEAPINKTGRYDIFTELYLRFSKNTNKTLKKLKEDTVIAYETGEPVLLLRSVSSMDLDFVAEKRASLPPTNTSSHTEIIWKRKSSVLRGDEEEEEDPDPLAAFSISEDETLSDDEV